ncbi:TlpA family protein disulfide reductase [Kaarinaea lacus]
MINSTTRILIILLFIFTIVPGYAKTDIENQEYQVTATDGTELSLIRYPAQGDHLIIWIAPGYGIHERSIQVAQQLAADGIEIWQIDLAEALFLPRSTEQMRSFTGHYVADLIQIAHKETNKKILLSARSYGAIPLLRGVRIWQERKPEEPYVTGAILFSPDLYTTIPSLGLEPEYLPIASATNIPIMIFQDGIRGNRWYVNNLIDTLLIGGSQPMLKILPGVSALFFEEDSAPETIQAFTNLPKDIQKSIKLLEKMPGPVTPAPMKEQFASVGSGIDIRMKKFKGNFLPYPIDLKDAANNHYQRDSYEGQITIINFWATWCPPCVEEIPSLNRLKDKMRDIPFELVSINYAESAATVTEFLQKVDVNFPVLLDETGKASIKWNVVAFPSTFIIGPDGKIHYGVNAAILWDSEEVISTLKQLYSTTRPVP